VVLTACNEPITQPERADSLIQSDIAMDATPAVDLRLEASDNPSKDQSSSDWLLDMAVPTAMDFGNEDVWTQTEPSDVEPLLDAALMDEGVTITVDYTQVTTQEYFPLLGSLPNPERGFYTHIETILSHQAPTELDTAFLNSLRGTDRRLVLLVVDLSLYKQTRVHERALERLDTYFYQIRMAGLKAIVRFRYTASASPPYGDATPARVGQHLDDLTTVLRANADIIMTLQAGFIGAWGEWYYSDHWGDLGQWSPQDQANRRALVAQLLSILPSSRTIQLRTPRYRTALFGSQHLCAPGVTLARIGHHNDCFLASETDFGTYQNTMVEYPWLATNTECVPMGGETCAVFGERSNCETALEEMRRFHWSYLNGVYHPDVITNWLEQGCLSNIEQHLGYRLTLDSLVHSIESTPGSPLKLQLRGRNVGFAAPINPREVVIILTSATDGRKWTVALDVDPRGWLDTFEVDAFVGIPAAMPLGHYRLFLRLSDPEPRLRSRPDYSIQLANEGLYDEQTGTHDLMGSVRVRAGRAVPYDGLDWFELSLDD
jgi:hypothetical protein